MVKWFVGLGLVIGFLSFFIIGSGSVSRQALKWIQEKEGGSQVVSQAADGDPAQFTQKYLPFLKERYYLCQYAMLMGNDQVAMEIIKETLALYKGSPLEQQPEYYQSMLFFEGQMYDNALMNSAALADYSKFVSLYPDNPLVPKAQRRVTNLQEAMH